MLSFQKKDDNNDLIMEGQVVKQGTQAHVTIPLSIRKKFAKGLKMDAGALFNCPVRIEHRNGRITITIEPEGR